MFNAIKSWFEKKPETTSWLSDPAAQFDMRARTESAKQRLEWAQKLTLQVTQLAAVHDAQGYSTGGISAEVMTISGRKDGAPKMDPMTVNVADAAGQPLFAVRLLQEKGQFRAEVDGMTRSCPQRWKTLSTRSAA
jgi:hypothetical protein